MTTPSDETGTMSDRRDRGDVSKRGRRRRVLLAGLCVVVGVVMMVRGAVGLGANGDPVYLLLGTGLVVAGIIAFFVARRPPSRGR